MGLGGVAAVALGTVADALDLRTALIACALAPVAGALCCLALPKPRGDEAVARGGQPAYPLL
jgi:hypothetical protein